MAKPSVYIETTVVGHLTTRLPKDPVVRGQMLATRDWWESDRQHFDLYTSNFVIEEVSAGDPKAAEERLKAIVDITLAPVTAGARELAALLVHRNALPIKARVDAAHLAVAATSDIDYLLTWNCRHLANATLRAKIEMVCRECGWDAPIICTPSELPKVRT